MFFIKSIRNELSEALYTLDSKLRSKTVITRYRFFPFGHATEDYELKEVVEAILKHLDLTLDKTQEIKPQIKLTDSPRIQTTKKKK